MLKYKLSIFYTGQKNTELNTRIGVEFSA